MQGVLRGEKFKTNRVAVSYRKSEVVECSDLSKVSEQFLRFKDPELDKTAVKKALKNGETVEGCSLVEKQNMTIR